MPEEDERDVPTEVDGGTLTRGSVGDGVPTEEEMHNEIVGFAISQGMEVSEADMAEYEASESIESDIAAAESGGESYELIPVEGMEEMTEEGGWVSAESEEETQVLDQEMSDAQALNGDNMMQTEEDLVDGIVGGMYVQMYLMEQDQIELWDSLGGPTPADMAHEAGLLTAEQVEWVNAPFHTEAETIEIIEEGVVIQMFTESELEEVGGEEYMVEQFLVDVGREDLAGNVIVLSDEEKQMIYDYRIGERGLAETTYGQLMSTAGGYAGLAIGGIRGTAGGGQLKPLLDELQGTGTNRDDTEAIGDDEKDEREDWGCISGVKDKHTCGGCRLLIGTCGPMSELPNPPFHKGCRCGKHRA
jgi:hypothetical protein